MKMVRWFATQTRFVPFKGPFQTVVTGVVVPGATHTHTSTPHVTTVGSEKSVLTPRDGTHDPRHPFAEAPAVTVPNRRDRRHAGGRSAK